MSLITETQKKAAQAIVDIFETGSVRGRYGKVTLIPGDTGQLTFGRSQTTLTSGGLHELISRYVASSGARFGNDLAPFVPRLENHEEALNHERHFKNLLRASADDPVMRDTQDEFFDDRYWATAERIARRDDISEPLGLAVIYDSVVHGSWPLIRRRTRENHGKVDALGEKVWITRYVEERHSWLANHSRSDLRRTTYRMDALGRLIDQMQWPLELPLVVRGLEINDISLHANPPDSYDGPEPRSRVVAVTSPITRGLDVRLAQLALSGLGYDVLADGMFGRVSRGIVQSFQTDHGLPASGALGIGEFEALGL